MNILITGGSGFIGSNLADALLANGCQVIALDNYDPFYDREIKIDNIKNAVTSANFKIVEGDIRDKALLNKIFTESSIDIVVHLAAKAGVRPSILNVLDYYDVNVNGTAILLEAMRENNVKNMIFASSSSIYGNNEKLPFSESDYVDKPISPYAATKKSGELLCHVYNHLYGFNITCLRFFTVIGPRQRPDLAINKFVNHIHNNQPIPFFGDGTSARDYTYVGDIVDGILKAIDKLDGYNIYNLGESSTITLMELVNTLGKLMEKEVIINKLPKQEGDVEITYADISKTRKEIGYNPKVDIETGLKHFLDWFYKSKR